MYIQYRGAMPTAQNRHGGQGHKTAMVVNGTKPPWGDKGTKPPQQNFARAVLPDPLVILYRWRWPHALVPVWWRQDQFFEKNKANP